MKINHLQIVVFSKTKWGQSWYLKTEPQLFHIFQSNEVFGISFFGRINKFVWRVGLKSLFKIISSTQKIIQLIC